VTRDGIVNKKVNCIYKSSDFVVAKSTLTHRRARSEDFFSISPIRQNPTDFIVHIGYFGKQFKPTLFTCLFTHPALEASIPFCPFVIVGVCFHFLRFFFQA